MEERKIPLSPGRQGDGVQLLGLGFRVDGGLFRVGAAAGHQDDGSAEDHHQTGDGKDGGADAAYLPHNISNSYFRMFSSAEIRVSPSVCA